MKGPKIESVISSEFINKCLEEEKASTPRTYDIKSNV
jgi:hypothetical protein